MNKKFTYITVFIAAFAFILAGCGPKIVEKQSALDTPQSHYDQGMKYLKQEKNEDAKREFDRSKGLDPEYSPAYEGLGLYYLSVGNHNMAKDNMNKSKDRKLDDKDYVPAWVGMGRVYHAQKKYEDAIDEFEDAIKKAKKNDTYKNYADPYLYLGHTYMTMENFSSARTAYEQGLEREPNNMVIDKSLEELSKIERASAGSSDPYKVIARSKAVTRAEVSVLFTSEFALDKIFKEKKKPKQAGFATPGSYMGKKAQESSNEGFPNDVPDKHWSRSYVEQVLEYGIIDQFPDGTFKPDEPVNKLNFAQLIENFLAKAFDDDGLRTRYIGGTSAFADVPSSHFAYNAVMTVSTRGIMKGNLDGTFGLMDTIPGSDAILIIKALKNQF